MRVLITGATGQLGPYLLGEFARCGHEVIAAAQTPRAPIHGVPVQTADLSNESAVQSLLATTRPDIVVNAAALARIPDALANPPRAFSVNAEAARHLASRCAVAGVRLVHISSDMVFDGKTGNYHEQSVANPLSVYGQSKLAGDAAVLTFPATTVARLPLMFGAQLTAGASHVAQIVASLRAQRPVKLFVDEWRTACSLANAARQVAALALSDHMGLYHLGGTERVSRYHIGLTIARLLGIDHRLVEPQASREVMTPEPRPQDLSLDIGKLRRTLPDLALPSFADDMRASLQEVR